MIFQQEFNLEFDTKSSEINGFKINVGYNDAEVYIIKDDQSGFCDTSDDVGIKLPNNDVSH